MQKVIFGQKYSPADILVLLLLGTVIYGVVSFGREWETSFHPSTDINLSLVSLPYYTLLSGLRGIVAYFFSLIFTLIVGYLAARSRRAEQILIPALDILQSIPVLGFLPGLVLALIAIFPRTNTGLELASIIMIFTGQVWNMTFSFYSSLKSIPADFQEVSRVIGLNGWQRFRHIEFPFSAMGLAWNSLLSMSGGWFFLSVCEAFTLGSQDYRLPGVGAYMAVAVQQGDTRAMCFGIVAMATLIIVMDLFIWRPVLAWAQQFRLEDVPGFGSQDPLIQQVIRRSVIVKWFNLFYRRQVLIRRIRAKGTEVLHKRTPWLVALTNKTFHGPSLTIMGYSLIALLTFLFGLGCFRLIHILVVVPGPEWVRLVGDTLITLVRVVGCLFLSSLWTVPAGIWIGTSPKRTSAAQPIIQVLASFPAPMLYPLALAVFFFLHLQFAVSSMLLMLIGVQWYILFNVLAGAMRIPSELKFAAELMNTSRWNMWTKLYIPSVFPFLVTGWVTAAGGAWNASIVAEYIAYRGNLLTTRGLGSSISIAASKADFPVLAASLAIMVIVVIALNRTVWARIYRLAQTRYRMDL